MIAKKRKFENPTIVKTVIFFLIFIIVGAVFWSVAKREDELAATIYPNVYIDGVSFAGKTKQEIVQYFNKKNQGLKDILITVLFQNISVATFSGTTLHLAYDGETSGERAYLVGRSSNFSSRIYQQIASLLNWQRFDFQSTIEYDTTAIKDFLDQSQDQYDKPAKNALFKFENGRVISFRKEENGLQILPDKFQEDFDNAIKHLKKKVENQTVVLSSQIIIPEITLAHANQFGIEELIGEGKSDFSHSIPNRIHNIILAASKFDGVLIPKDKILSFNQTVGDISSLTGYQQAYIIKEGKTVLGDGGGVCQVSTTLFRAALNAGLPIVERVAHAYRVGYYENDSKPGFDATVFDPYADLKIKNDTGAYILIETEVDRENNLLYFRFYGKKDNRRVTISSYQMWDVSRPPDPSYQDDPTLKKGEIKQIDFAAWGSKVTFNYKVTRDSQTIFEKNFFSAYRPWQAVYLRGTAD